MMYCEVINKYAWRGVRGGSMSPTISIPTQAEFLAAPIKAVSTVAPRSMVYAPGGTRRSAAFDGIEPWSAEYIALGQLSIVACLDIIFSYGVEHVFTPMLMMGHTNEVEDIEQQLILPLARYVTDPRLIGLFQERGWRLKIAPS